MRKKFLASVLGCMVVGAAYTGYHSYAAYESDNVSDLLLTNVEALAQNGNEIDNGEYPRYKNDLITESEKEFSVQCDSNGVSIQYKRTCVIFKTYCKYTGEDNDICYGRLNQTERPCGQWKQD